MNAQTLEALKASIAKWERNAEAKTPDGFSTGTRDCPLCRIFHSSFGGDSCEGCPVFDAGHHACRGTPYDSADRAMSEWLGGIEGAADRAHAAARDEVAFLKSLLPVQP